MFRRFSLRARLVLGVIVLAAIGLAAADVITYTSLRSFLLDRTDRSLDAEHMGIEQTLLRRQGREPDGPRPSGAGPGDYVEIRQLDGRVTYRHQAPELSQEASLAPPRLPATIFVPSTSEEGADRATYLTVPAERGDGRYRVRASVEPGTSVMLIVATSLADVDSTLHRLLLIELLVTAAVLAAVAGLGLWVVRLGLRPLDAIGSTAAAIAAGDLSRRVERAEERTEVGRLGLALNAMLGQIETAFKAREASERKLRRFVADASHELR